MTFRSDTTNVKSKDSLLGRKADKFRAILSESDNSDEEFKSNTSAKKTSKLGLSNKSNSKKSKLKLGGKLKPQQSSNDFANPKPAQTKHDIEVSEATVSQTPRLDSPNLESELFIIHSISSQETVVLTPCECTSQDLSDSDSETCYPTLKLESQNSLAAASTEVIYSDDCSKTNEETGCPKPRLKKRKIVDDEETMVDMKKSKTDTVDLKLPLSPSGKEDCTLIVEANEEECTADKSGLREVSTLEVSVGKESEKATLPILVDITQSEVFSPQKFVALRPRNHPTLKKDIRPTKEDEQQMKKPNAQTNKQQPLKKRLKDSSPASKKEKEDAKKNTHTISKRAGKAVLDTPREHLKQVISADEQGENQLAKEVQKKFTVATEKCESSNYDSIPVSIQTENSYTPSVIKNETARRTKAWNPPGRSLGKESTPGSSPSTGRLRLGLSRKRHAKPLHPEIKPKTSQY